MRERTVRCLRSEAPVPRDTVATIESREVDSKPTHVCSQSCTSHLDKKVCVPASEVDTNLPKGFGSVYHRIARERVSQPVKYDTSRHRAADERSPKTLSSDETELPRDLVLRAPGSRSVWEMADSYCLANLKPFSAAKNA